MNKNEVAERLYWEFDDRRSKKDRSERECFKNTIIPHITEATAEMFTAEDMKRFAVNYRQTENIDQQLTQYRQKSQEVK